MTDSTDNNKPNNDNPQPEQPDDINKASNDLTSAAEEAMRLLKQSQDEAARKHSETTSAAAVEEDNGNTTNDLQQDAFKAMKIEGERKREAEEKARSAVKERSTFTETMRLKLESSESGDPIVKVVNEELIVGRADNVTDYVPDIDLTPHGAYRLGLSRRHAIIMREGDRLLVKDLNSRNGTFVNGSIVPSGGTHIVRDGDEVRFGNLIMQVTFEGE
jgi:pSer/pThr/pTyr-binding forkhead associated (FHA) protein